MGHCLYLKKGNIHTVPVGSLKLGNIAEGTLVKIPENGVMTEFYVAKHNYESGLNGNGRTLMVRKELVRTTFGDTNEYEYSRLDYLLTDFSKNFPMAIQQLIGSTKFYLAKSKENIAILDRPFFTLSATEVNFFNANAPIEGSPLPNAEVLRNGIYGNETIDFWTRSKYFSTRNDVVWITSTENSVVTGHTYNQYYARPIFTLPATTPFDAKTLEIKI